MTAPWLAEHRQTRETNKPVNKGGLRYRSRFMVLELYRPNWGNDAKDDMRHEVGYTYEI